MGFCLSADWVVTTVWSLITAGKLFPRVPDIGFMLKNNETPLVGGAVPDAVPDIFFNMKNFGAF